MNWAIKINSKTLITKISHISWGITTKRGLRYNDDIVLCLFIENTKFKKIFTKWKVLDGL